MRVRYTATALQELEEIIAYIARDNPVAAGAVASEIERAIGMISRHPLMAPKVHESGLRAKLITRYPYRIFYTVADDELIVRNIRSTYRLPPWEAPN